MFDLAGLESRLAELRKVMESADFWNDQQRATKVNREEKRTLEELDKWKALGGDVEDAEVLLDMADEEDDQDTADEAGVAFDELNQRLVQAKFEQMLAGEHDYKDCFLYVNSGAGGTEAMDWTGMLSRMYMRYCERMDYEVELVDEQPGEEAGLKNITFAVHGPWAYGYLKAESGVHRLVRISPFDANKRRHTSFAAVFVMPDVEEDIEVEIDPDDLRIDTYRASGHGGQKVNKTDSAVRITHIPTGVVVQCQNERSQHKNKAFAMKVLKARLYAIEEKKQQEKLEAFTSDKKDIEWGSQIRSYVMQPYQLVKDVRTAHETGNVQAVLDGDVQPFIETYLMQKSAEGKPKPKADSEDDKTATAK